METVAYILAIAAAAVFLSLILIERRRANRLLLALYGVAACEIMDASDGVIHSFVVAWSLVIAALTINAILYIATTARRTDDKRNDRIMSFGLLIFGLAYFTISATLTTNFIIATVALAVFLSSYSEIIFISRLYAWRRQKNADPL